MEKRYFSLLAHPSIVIGTVGIWAAKVSFIETNFSWPSLIWQTHLCSTSFHCPQFWSYSSSVYQLVDSTHCKSVLANRVRREFKNRVSRSIKYSRFFGHRSPQARFLIFVYLVLIDGVRYRLFLLNANFRRLNMWLFFVEPSFSWFWS